MKVAWTLYTLFFVMALLFAVYYVSSAYETIAAESHVERGDYLVPVEFCE